MTQKTRATFGPAYRHAQLERAMRTYRHVVITTMRADGWKVQELRLSHDERGRYDVHVHLVAPASSRLRRLRRKVHDRG